MTLNLGSFQMPLNAATKTFALLAKRGAGKSYTGAVLAEEFYANNIPFIVFDPIDVWWGLRLNKDGKEAGLPVVVFGLEHADIQLDRDMGREIARAVVKENISCVISTFGMPKVGQRFLIAEFAEEILNINNTPRHIFIEEAHEFVPQRVMGALGKTFNAVSNLVVMGRNRGLGVTLINQRAATINKDVLTQIDTLLAFRNIAPQDRKALREWVEYHAAEGDFDAFMQSLPSLPTGEGWMWSPEFLQTFQKIKIRKRRTFHPDREKLGDEFVMPQLSQTDVQGFIERFQRSQNVQTQEEKPKRGRPKKQTGYQQPAEQPSSVSLQLLKNEYESKLIAKDVEINKLNQIIESIRRIVGADVAIPQPATGSGQLEMWVEKLGGESKGGGRILKFLAKKHGLKFTRSQIALAIGMTARSGTFSDYIATLKRNKLILTDSGYIFVNPDIL